MYHNPNPVSHTLLLDRPLCRADRREHSVDVGSSPFLWPQFPTDFPLLCPSSICLQVLELPELLRPFLTSSDRLSASLCARWLLPFRNRASVLHLRVDDCRTAHEAGQRLLSPSTFTGLKALQVQPQSTLAR